MYLMARAIKSLGIKMVLSGEGADELFGGYNRYFSFPKRWNQLKKYPSFLASPMDALLNKTSIPFSSSLGKKAFRINRLLKAKDRYEFYLEIRSGFTKILMLS